MEKRFPDNTDDERAPAPAPPPPEPEQPLLSDIGDFLKDTKTVLPLTMLGLFLLAFVGFLYFSKPFCMPIFFAVTLSFLLKPVVNVLERIKIPRWLGALVVIVAFVSLMSIVF